jgi:ArsR family transcriptional regulator
MGGNMDDQVQADATIFKAFCNEYRLQALERLRTGEKCACDLLEHIQISQSNLSHHMKILVESGVVNARQEGKWTYYSIDPDGAARAVARLAELTKVEGKAAHNPACD